MGSSENAWPLLQTNNEHMSDMAVCRLCAELVQVRQSSEYGVC